MPSGPVPWLSPTCGSLCSFISVDLMPKKWRVDVFMLVSEIAEAGLLVATPDQLPGVLWRVV